MKKIVMALSLALMAISVSGQQKKGIQYKEYDLPNGLHVILYQDHTSPNVMIGLMYHVGAKNENPNRTGFAHLFEHLMFEGSENVNRGEFSQIVQSNGGNANANTTQDRTYYFEQFPANQLELGLWLESDRMYKAKIDTIGVETQKGVVIEERKQTQDNRPYGNFMEEIGKRLFTVHPYQWSTIGYPEHIRNSTFGEVYDFYKTYYVPNNAVLVVGGDFDEKQARAWIDKYFAPIPKGKPIERPNIVEPQQQAEIRDVIYDKIQLPGIFIGYHEPTMGTKDAYALEILNTILSEGNNSRMTKNIVDKGLAVQATSFPYIQENPGVMYVLAIANMGIKLEDLEAAINTEIDKMRTELVSEDEFQMAIAAKEYQIATSLSSLDDIVETFCNEYTYFKDASRINKQLGFYENITREDIRNVAQKYLTKNNRVVLYYLPESQKE